MDNRLIFLYRWFRAKAEPGLLRKTPSGVYRPNRY
jgi:hypothetical protein